MTIVSRLFAAAIVAGTSMALAAPVLAAGAGEKPPRQSWSFYGPFGTFDKAQLQRGFKVYREVCSACHGLEKVSFRNLSEPGGPGFTEGQVKALAAEYKVKDGPNDQGEMFERPRARLIASRSRSRTLRPPRLPMVAPFLRISR